jgi:predicted lipid-binding transport protein (Tim44 family)
MKNSLAVLAVVLSLGATAVFDAQAKRLGGARSSGMQREAVTAPATPPRAVPGTPSQAAPAAAPTAGAAAAAAPKRSWMGPIAGLAAGLGLAALASYLGFGEALANMMMIGLLVMAVLLAVGFIMRKRAAGQGQGPTLAGAGAGAAGPAQQPTDMFRTGQGSSQPAGGSLIGSRIGAGLAGGVAAAQAAAIPADFDAAGFARTAKAQFISLQAANDARDLDRLRDYLTPEMFEVVSADIAARGDAAQHTEVFGLEAQVLAVAEEESRYVVSVRFTGSVRDQHGAVPEELDEIWHLVKGRVGNAGWVIAGIQQRAAGPEAA